MAPNQKESALFSNETPVAADKNNAVAFVNWALPLADGSTLKASKGFPIFQNPKYPNKHEDILVDLAKKNGGSVTLLMECKVMLNNGKSLADFDLDSIVITPVVGAEPVQPVPTETIQ